MAFLLRRPLIQLSSRTRLSRDPTIANLSRQYSTQSERLTGKVALITGAASGIGKATAAEFVRHGAKVIIADIQRQLGEQTAVELGPAATFTYCDVTEESSIAAAVDLAVTQHGRLDIAYNNAGISGSAKHDLASLDLVEFDRVIAINLRGVVAGVKHAARVMIPSRSGSILCTASVTGILGGMAPLPYSVSKFAVAGLVKVVAAELGTHGVRVNCISPTAIPTPMSMEGMAEIFPSLNDQQKREIVHSTGELKGANCEVEDIAKAALFLASEEAKYISGHNLVVDGGFTTFKKLGFSLPLEAM